VRLTEGAQRGLEAIVGAGGADVFDVRPAAVQGGARGRDDNNARAGVLKEGQSGGHAQPGADQNRERVGRQTAVCTLLASEGIAHEAVVALHCCGVRPDHYCVGQTYIGE
jgi:hypothetical protein